MSENENDVLDSLLESLSDDQEMEKKINEFARNKERSLRIQRARQTSEQFQKTYASTSRNTDANQQETSSEGTEEESSADDGLDIPSFMNRTQQEGSTVTIQAGEMKTAASAGDATKEAGLTRTIPMDAHSISSAAGNQESSATRVFSEEDAPAQEAESSTVTVSDDEIRTLLDKDQPILTREYIQPDGEEEEEEDIPAFRAPKIRKKKNSRALGIGLGALLAVLLIGGGGYMVYSTFLSHPSVAETSIGFNRLMDWVKGYADLSDDDKKKIADYRSIYDKLSEDEKRKVNEALMSATGKTFDELLAAATGQEKPQASNDNLVNAEKKAKLKDQIDTLQSEINDLNAQLASVSQRIADAQTDYNNKNAAYQSAQAAVSSAQANYDSLKAQLDGLSDDSALQSQIDTLQSQLDALGNDRPGTSENNPDDSSAQKPSNDNSAQRENLQKQIDDLKAQMASNKGSAASLQSQVAQAQSDLNAAQAALEPARQASDTAYGAWQAIINDTDPIQQQINEKTARQAELQQEYNSIG